MTAVLDMRDRLAAALQVELRNRGLGSGADIAFAVADKALEGVQFEQLVEMLAGADGVAAAYGDITPPPDIDDRLTRWQSARTQLEADPIYSQVLA